MKYQNLSELLQTLNPKIEEHGFMSSRSEPTSSLGFVTSKKSSQKGVVRSNCIDNLDRTNVVQSVIGRKLLLEQLHHAKIISAPSGAPFEVLPIELEQMFRNMWTEHADCLSKLYSGTGALKTDFTKTGKRTKMGMVEDGRRSMIRYFLNNYEDPYKQNALHLLLGKIEVKDLEGKEKNMANNSFIRLMGFIVLPLVFSSLLYGAFDRKQNWSFLIGVLVMCFMGAGQYMMDLNKRMLGTLCLKE